MQRRPCPAARMHNSLAAFPGYTQLVCIREAGGIGTGLCPTAFVFLTQRKAACSDCTDVVLLFHRLQVSNAKRRDPLIAPFIQLGDRPEVLSSSACTVLALVPSSFHLCTAVADPTLGAGGHGHDGVPAAE